MTTLDGWLLIGEVFAMLVCFWVLLIWALNRINDRLSLCTCNYGYDPMCHQHGGDLQSAADPSGEDAQTTKGTEA